MSSEKITESGPDNIINTIYEVRHEMQETEDNFIFSTLQKYAMREYQIVVDKKELNAAIELLREMRKNGIDICEPNAKEDAAYSRGWDAGYERGFEAAMDHVSQFADRKKNLEKGRRKRYDQC